MIMFKLFLCVCLLSSAICQPNEESDNSNGDADPTTKPPVKTESENNVKEANDADNVDNDDDTTDDTNPEDDKQDTSLGDEFCSRYSNDLITGSVPEVTNILNGFKTAIAAVPQNDDDIKETDELEYWITPKLHFDHFKLRCREKNLHHLALNTKEEIELVKLLMNDKSQPAKKDANKLDDIWFVAQRGNGVDKSLYSYSGQMAKITSTESDTFKDVDKDEQNKCASVVLDTGNFIVKPKVCALHTPGICVRRKDFTTILSKRAWPIKQELLGKIEKVLPNVEKIKKYLKSKQSSSCLLSPAPSETVSTALKRTFSVLRETPTEGSFPLTNVLTRLDKIWDFLLILEGFINDDEKQIEHWIHKLLSNTFMDLSVSTDEKVLCLCPPNKFLFKIKDYLARVPQLEGFLDFIELDKRMRLTEIILTFLTALALIVAFIGIGLQRRQMVLKEKRHKEREQRRREEAGLTDGGELGNEYDINDGETPETKRRISFANIITKKKKTKNTTTRPRISSSSSSNSLNSQTLIPIPY